MGLTVRDRVATALLGTVLTSIRIAGLADGPAQAEPAAGLAGAALRDFDPVSHLRPDGPAPGSARFELSRGGRVWRFASEGERAAFRADPAVYALRPGGRAVAGVLDACRIDSDPSVFTVIADRLYLFRDAERRAGLLADPGLARAAEAAWPSLHRLTDGSPE